MSGESRGTMSGGVSRRWPGSKPALLSHLPIVPALACVFGFYQVLIANNPMMYWHDPYIRWALRDELVLGRWLPGIQVVVFLASRLSTDFHVLRTLVSLVSVGSLFCAYLLARKVFTPGSAVLASLFLAGNMMFAALAIVPYSHVLFAGILFLVLYFLKEPALSGRNYFLVICLLNLGSLTSYEGWFVSLLFVGYVTWSSWRAGGPAFAITKTVQTACLVSIAPAAWLLFGVSGGGSLWQRLWSIYDFVIWPAEPTLLARISDRLNFNHLWAFSLQFLRLLAWQTRVIFLILGLLGLLAALSGREHRPVHWMMLAVLLLDWGLLALVQPWGFGNLRQTFLTVTVITFYSAHGLVKGIDWLYRKVRFPSGQTLPPNRIPLVTSLAVLGLMAWMIPSTVRFIHENAGSEEVRNSSEVGTWLDERLGPGDAVLVVDDSSDNPYLLGAFMRYPVEHILDDRLEPAAVVQGLAAARMVYVVGMYSSRGGLSPQESCILAELEGGQLDVERFIFDAIQIWYLPASALPACRD